MEDRFVATAQEFAFNLCEFLREHVEDLDEIFEGDLVRNRSFRIEGNRDTQIRLRDASGFDVMLNINVKAWHGSIKNYKNGIPEG